MSDVVLGDGVTVSLELRGGERVLLVLPDRVERSAIVHTLLGWLAPRGRIDVLGHVWPLDPDALSVLLERWVGIVSTDVPLIDSLTVEANIALPNELHGTRDRDHLEAVIGALGIPPLRKRLPPTLSEPESFRCRLARALVHRPSVVLIDLAGVTPLTGMDNESFYATLETLVPRSGLLLLDDSARDTAWVTRVVKPAGEEAA